jgi:signal transduction histidine kinase/ActR/RegA family two-component response regulator
MQPDAFLLAPRPSRATSVAVSAALVVILGFIRLVVFDTTMFPLTYAVPLLVCVWTRDRLVLWCMAATFISFHAVKLFWIVPPGTFPDPELWTNFSATVTNVTVGATAVHLIITLRDRVERAFEDLRAQADELRAQGEELTQQNEELTGQGEELTAQNEELQSQAEEIGTLNDALQRREHLLEALLEMARLSPTEAAALEHIARASLTLFQPGICAVAVYERAGAALARRVFVSADALAAPPLTLPGEPLVTLIAEENHAAAIDDLAQRPDLVADGLAGIHAVLGAPIPLGEGGAGAFVVYAAQPRAWSEDDFRLAEWLAAKSARVLHTLRLQAALRDGDRRKSEFLATLSHELRNPLAPMRYAIELLEAAADRGAHAVPILKRQFQQLVRLVDDLLDATRLSSNKIALRKTRVELGTLVRDAVEGCRPDIAAAGHTLTLEIAPHPIAAHGDPERLSQVVTNLLSNAIRYTPAGGHITLSVATDQSDAVLTVSDDGMGLDSADLERIFEMFTQVGGPGSEGLGIGLALVRGIVELHGGRVDARSDGPGRGSRFRVTLPISTGTGATMIDGAASLPAARSPRRVLIVDDNVDAATMMASLLELHGHCVRVAHDAEGALEASRRFDADVALLDIGLPGTDGYELARQLRAAAGSRPIRLVAVTGWGQEGDRARAHAAGFDFHLTKPAEPAVVLAALQTTSSLPVR